MSESLRVVSVPCLKDNYAYLLVSENADTFVVDPGEAAPIRDAVAQLGLRLCGILNTHHHYDHVGGNLELAAGHLPIYAFHSDEGRVPGLTHALQDDEEFEILGQSVRTLHVPGHTLGAITYQFSNFSFTGDTVFCGGAGRIFEGTPEQMQASFERITQALQPSDLLYTGHEYTEANLRFALSLWPEDEAVQERLRLVREQRARGKHCATGSLALELETNPFFRVSTAEYRNQIGLGGQSAASAFAEVRRLKNIF